MMKSPRNGEKQKLTIISLIVILLVVCPLFYTYLQSATAQTTQPGDSSDVRPPQWSTAKVDFSKAISEAPGHKEAYLSRGQAHWRNGKIVSAINEWKKAVEIDPRSSQAWLMLGDAYAKLDQKLDAIDCYNQLEGLETTDIPKDRVADNIRKLERAAVEEESSPLWERCRFFLEDIKFVTRPPQLILSKGPMKNVLPTQTKQAPQDLEDQAVIAQKNGDYDKAVELYTKYIASEPKNPKHHANLAIVLELLGKYEEAIKEYETVSNLDPKDADAMVAIGDIYSISFGDDKSALYWYAKAIQATPDKDKKKAIGERISKFMLGAKGR
jgi:tetratricopeptide (TPR) repeat protein